MAEVIRLPRMSDTMQDGNIIAWSKKVGDTIRSGDVLAEIETDKATMELESFQSGVLLHIEVEKGRVPVEGVIAIIGKAGEDISELKASIGAPVVAAAPTPVQPSQPQSSQPQSSQPQSSQPSPPVPVVVPVSQPGHGDRLRVSPLARALAREKGVDLHQLRGSGDDGRIVKQDVLQAERAAGALPVPVSAIAADTTVEVSAMRRVIAQRLSESKYTAPHFYLSVSIDVEQLVATRKKVNELHPDQKVSINDFVLKASAFALKKHPVINSTWQGDRIVQFGQVNIAVAVAAEEGLFVPVVRNVDQKSLLQISAEVKDLAIRARERRLTPVDWEGSTFTVSNLGMFGIDQFTAIINPPNAAILAVGAVADAPVVKDGQLVVGQTMTVTLSGDHRVVDGLACAQFLQTLKFYLQEPLRML